jgi:hypothetical protein
MDGEIGQFTQTIPDCRNELNDKSIESRRAPRFHDGGDKHVIGSPACRDGEAEHGQKRGRSRPGTIAFSHCTV